MIKFVGAYLLIAGLNMLSNYTGTVEFMLSMAGKPSMAALAPVSDLVSQLVAYTWPIVKPLLGLALLMNFRRCQAIQVLLVYLLLFLLGQLMAGDMTGGTFTLLFAFFVCSMKAYGSHE